MWNTETRTPRALFWARPCVGHGDPFFFFSFIFYFLCSHFFGFFKTNLWFRKIHDLEKQKFKKYSQIEKQIMNSKQCSQIWQKVPLQIKIYAFQKMLAYSRNVLEYLKMKNNYYLMNILNLTNFFVFHEQVLSWINNFDEFFFILIFWKIMIFYEQNLIWLTKFKFD